MRDERIVGKPLCIGDKPFLIILEPLLELLGVQRLLPTFFKDGTDIVGLHPLHSFIVSIAQSVQLPLLTQESRHALLVTQRSQGLEIKVLRMQGESRDNVIWIRVAPRTG